MREQLEQRLAELKAEYERGRKLMSDLEAQQATLQNTLLRINGAMQVLEELLLNAGGRPASQPDPANHPANDLVRPDSALPLVDASRVSMSAAS